MKTCPKCKQELDFTSFNKNKAKKDGYNSFCRICSNAASKSHYLNNRADRIEYQKKNKSRRKGIATDYVNSTKIKCTYCDESTPCCLDYHHINPSDKEYSVSSMVAMGYPKETIDNEIAKCIVVCSNCHRKIHYGLM
jgi:hypothetical protein